MNRSREGRRGREQEKQERGASTRPTAKGWLPREAVGHHPRCPTDHPAQVDSARTGLHQASRCIKCK